MVGGALSAMLKREGHQVTHLVRRPASGEGECPWNPGAGTIDAGALEGLDAVVHLAGESIASGRWNAAQKARILNSRVQGTRLLSETLAALKNRPAVLVSASAIGYYGDRGAEEVDESSAPGTGFLAEVCQAWEAATQPAQAAGIRTVSPRIGVVLAREGGALPRMLLPFRLGLGGRLGSGTQYMSWISLEDLLGILRFALDSTALSGPVNAVAPNPVTNAEFTRVLARTLRRPALFTAPAFAIRLALGEMGQELLLSGARVLPRKLPDAGYSFRHAELASALRSVL